jgi:hypothetical protein
MNKSTIANVKLGFVAVMLAFGSVDGRVSE